MNHKEIIFTIHTTYSTIMKPISFFIINEDS